MPRRRFWIVFAALTAVASCSDPEHERVKATTIPTYDPVTGKLTRLTADLDKNGKIDTYTYMDGTRVLRSEIDADEDGKIEKWEYHGEDGKVARVGISREKNGKPDAWTYVDAAGVVTRGEFSSEQDETKIDRWEWYENGALVRSEEDASGDGKVDKWTTYGPGGVLLTVMLDENYDGTADRRLTYGDGGRLLSIASDPDGNGAFRKTVMVSKIPR